MTKQQAVMMVYAYSDLIRGRIGNGQMPFNTKTRLLEGTFARWKGGSKAKAMRWLGWMQGAMWALGVFSLEELKQHSKTRTVPWR